MSDFVLALAVVLLIPFSIALLKIAWQLTFGKGEFWEIWKMLKRGVPPTTREK